MGLWSVELNSAGLHTAIIQSLFNLNKLNTGVMAAIIQLLLIKSTTIITWILRTSHFFTFHHMMTWSLTIGQCHIHTFPGRWFMTNWSSSADIQPVRHKFIKTYQDQITIFVFAESLECIFVVNFYVIFVIFFPNHLQRLKITIKDHRSAKYNWKVIKTEYLKESFHCCWSLFFERKKISCYCEEHICIYIWKDH